MKIRPILNSLLVLTWLLFSCENDETPGPPTITSFTPSSGNAEFSGTPATSVTITGTNFGDDLAGASVQFYGTNATITSLTMTDIVVTVPAGATTGKITVTVRGESTESADTFTVIHPPTITSFAPMTSVAGARVIITGTNFATTLTDNAVTFNNVAATVTDATATELTVTVPQDATSGKISVISNGLSTVSTSDFTVIPDPTQGRSFPRKLQLIYFHADFVNEKDTLWYDYTYNDGRIASITRKLRSWKVWPGCDPFLDTCPILLKNSTQRMEFIYLNRQILINVSEEGNHLESYSFDFDNDLYLYPYLFKKYDATGAITAEEPMTYEEDFLTEYIKGGGAFFKYPLSVESGNILISYNGTSFIDYTQNPSPISQFSGFDYFTYRPFGWGGIDPVAIVFKWFRPSKNLINILGPMGGFYASYSYEFSNDRLTSINSTCHCSDHVTWEATIEY